MTAKPYYTDDHATIFLGDCRDMPEVLVAADVLVTDPPYGIDAGVRSPRRCGMPGRRHIVTEASSEPVHGDHDTTMRDDVLTLWGGSRPALVFGSWRADRPAGVRARLLWLKAGTTAHLGATPWSPADEEIYVMGAGWAMPKRLNYYVTSEARAGSGGLAAMVGHPTPKPVGLMRDLLAECPPGVVVDPFMGSGSTLRAAKDLGRQVVGIEIDERYCEIAAKRLAQEVLVFG